MSNEVNSLYKEKLKKDTLKNSFWILISKSSNFIIQLIVTILLSRMLTATEFGIVSAVLLFVNFFEIFSIHGIATIIVQRKDIDEDFINCTNFISIVLGFLFFVFVNLEAEFISNLLNVGDIKSIIQWLSLLFILYGFLSVPEALMQRKLKFKEIGIIKIISYTIGYGITGVTLAYQGFGVWALIFANIVNISVTLFAILLVEKNIPRCKVCKKYLNEIIKTASGYSFARIATYIGLQGDNYIVGNRLGAEMLGIYGKAYQFFSMPVSFLGEIFEKALFSTICRIQEDDNEIKYYYLKALNISAIFLLPISCFFVINGKEIITLLLGDNWNEVVIPFQFLSIGLFFRTAYKAGDAVLKAKKKVRLKIQLEVLYAILVILSALLGTLFGINTVAFCVTIVIIFNFIIITYCSNKILNLNFVLCTLSFIPMIGASCIITIILKYINNILNKLFLPDFTIVFLSGIMFLMIQFLIVLIWNFYNGKYGIFKKGDKL